MSRFDQEFRQPLNDSEIQKLDALIEKGWQIIKFGLKIGIFFPKTRQAFESIDQAFIYQMAIDSLLDGATNHFELSPQLQPTNNQNEVFNQSQPTNNHYEVSTQPQPTKEVVNDNPVNAELTMQSSTSKRKSTPVRKRPSKRTREETLVTSDKDFSQIWSRLKELGWNHFTGDRIHNFFYAMPEVVKRSDGIRGVNMFTLEETITYFNSH